MDEILIGEKKYVSSKQAAKVTGYAKDYIGQLCREGRVPARLVGRSWYVLETAIHDHRFGEQKIEREIEAKNSEAPAASSAWESPRYSASDAETLPSVNRLRDTEGGEGNDASQHLQDSWRAWFDRIADSAPIPSIPDIVPEKPQKAEKELIEEMKEKEEVREEREVTVPVRAVYHQPPEELLPHRSGIQLPSNEGKEEEQMDSEEKMARRGGRKSVMVMQVAGALFALLIAGLAVVGTGYFDEYIVSNTQAGILAGVEVYNR
ncbi:hypothetical protein KGQ72_01900 [Patescibacteria group bacterium]|nr:hypothetical protein [Patescibacteria group bacterium]